MTKTLGAAVVVIAALASTPGMAGEQVNTKSARVVVYGAFASNDKVHALGRVIEDHAVRANKKRGRLANVVENLRSMETDEVPNAHLNLRLREGDTHGSVTQASTLTTDEEGLFHVELDRVSTSSQVQLRLALSSTTHHARTEVVDVHVVGEGPVVVSDFDDTLAHTYVANKAKLALEVMSKNASQLQMIDGADQAFARGEHAGVAAFFYLSSSPLAFFDRIQDFLALHKLPSGTVLLKDYGSEDALEHHGYKTRRLEMLLQALPDKQFILVGDAGEADPDIYRDVRQRHPGRIVRIVIRIPAGVADDKKDPSRFQDMTTVSTYNDNLDALVLTPDDVETPQLAQ